MKEGTHPFLVSMHSVAAKIEQLTKEFKIRQISDPGPEKYWLHVR